MNIADHQLTEITELAVNQLRLEAEIESLNTELESKTTSLRNLSEVLLPEAMMAVGMESFTLEDGSKIAVTKFYSGSIKPENAEAAFSWLRTTGNDSLIKREVKCMFGKGEDSVAEKIVNVLRAAGVIPQDKSSVHPMTLKSFIREQVESGNTDFPMELFGAYIGNKTKITVGKK
jgi:hypothetical protein